MALLISSEDMPFTWLSLVLELVRLEVVIVASEELLAARFMNKMR